MVETFGKILGEFLANLGQMLRVKEQPQAISAASREWRLQDNKGFLDIQQLSPLYTIREHDE